MRLGARVERGSFGADMRLVEILIEAPDDYEMSPAGVVAIRKIVWGMDVGIGTPQCVAHKTALVVDVGDLEEAVTVLQDLWKENLVKTPKPRR